MNKFLPVLAIVYGLQSQIVFSKDAVFSDLENRLIKVETRLKNKELSYGSNTWYSEKKFDDRILEMGSIGNSLKENDLKIEKINSELTSELHLLYSEAQSLKEKNKISKKEFENFIKRQKDAAISLESRMSQLNFDRGAVKEHLYYEESSRSFAEYLKHLKLPAACSLSVVAVTDKMISVRVKNENKTELYNLNFVTAYPDGSGRRETSSKTHYDPGPKDLKGGTIKTHFSDDDLINQKAYEYGTTTIFVRKKGSEVDNSTALDIIQNTEGRVLSFEIKREQAEGTITNKVKSLFTSLDDAIVCKEEDPKLPDSMINDSSRSSSKAINDSGIIDSQAHSATISK